MSNPFSTTFDAFLDGRVMARQPETGFRSGLDAVFLAAACPAKAGDRVLEAGCGVGVSTLCLLARVQFVKATGVEIDPDLASLAQQNAVSADAGSNFKVVAADVTAGWTSLRPLGLREEGYDHVMANPPYYAHARSRVPKDRRNARSRAMGEGDLDGWLRFLAAAVKPGGTCTVIHTAEALPELFNMFDGRFGGLRVLPLHPRANAAAIRVIVQGTKGSRAPISIAPGFVLHDTNGAQTEAANAVLRGGDSLF